MHAQVSGPDAEGGGHASGPHLSGEGGGQAGGRFGTQEAGGEAGGRILTGSPQVPDIHPQGGTAACFPHS